MSYKNSSGFGSILSSDCSGDSVRSRKQKNNADIFEERGMSWTGELPEKTPHLSPNGQLRMSRRAHLYCLLADARKQVNNILNPPQQSPDSHREDLSFSTEHCRPIDVRLGKEQNTIHPSVKTASKPSSRRQDLLVQASANLRTKRAQRMVKVK